MGWDEPTPKGKINEENEQRELKELVNDTRNKSDTDKSTHNTYTDRDKNLKTGIDGGRDGSNKLGSNFHNILLSNEFFYCFI